MKRRVNFRDARGYYGAGNDVLMDVDCTYGTGNGQIGVRAIAFRPRLLVRLAAKFSDVVFSPPIWPVARLLDE